MKLIKLIFVGKSFCLLGLTVGLVAGLVLAGSTHRNINILLKDAGSISIRPATPFELFSDSKCTININSKSGRMGSLDMSQDFFDSPIIVIPSPNDDVFLCIYYYDVDTQLFKIDLSKGSKALPNGSILSAIILASNCKVERVLKDDTNDWALAANALEQMSGGQFKRVSIPSLDLVVFHKYYSQKLLAASMHNFGDQGQYPGDAVIPSYIKQ